MRTFKEFLQEAADKPLTFAQKLSKLAKEHGAGTNSFRVPTTTSVQNKLQTWNVSVDIGNTPRTDLTKLIDSDDEDTLKIIRSKIASRRGDNRPKVVNFIKAVAADKDWEFLGYTTNGLKSRDELKSAAGLNPDDLPPFGNVWLYFDNSAENKPINRKYTRAMAAKELESHVKAAVKSAGLEISLNHNRKQQTNDNIVSVFDEVGGERKLLFITGHYWQASMKVEDYKIPLDKKPLQKILDYYKPYIEEINKKLPKPISVSLKVTELWGVKCAILEIKA